MLRLNLLTEELKKDIKDRRLYRLLLGTELILLSLLAALGGIFLTAEKILAGNIQKLNQAIYLQIQSSSNEYEVKARKINSRLALVAKIQAGFVPYSPLLDKISALIPDGVTLSYLNINTQDQGIKIRGSAAKRDDLLALEKNLEEAAFLSKVEIPLSAKLKKENIEFDLDLGLKPENFPPPAN